MTLRVLVFTNTYPSKQHTVIGLWLLEQVRSLRQKGVECDVIHINPEETYMNYLRGLRELVKRIRSHRCDIIHTHHTYTVYLAYLARLLAARSIPIVFTCHEQQLLERKGTGFYGGSHRRTHAYSPLRFLRYSPFLRRLAASMADSVIFVSRELVERVSPSVPTELIQCGIDLDSFRPLDQEGCRRQLGLSPDTTVIFFPGDVRKKHKRFELAQETFTILRRRLTGDVTMLAGGDIPLEQMPLYYNAADVVLQTALAEASPTIIKEALACEVPVVSTDCGDTRDMLQGIPYCFVCEDNANALADHVQVALAHRAVGGRERIRERRLSLDQIADRVIEVYSRVLADTTSAPELL